MVDTTQSMMNSSLLAGPLPPPAKSGWARKYKNLIRGYKKRWVVLEGDVFYYFENNKQAQEAQNVRMSSMLTNESDPMDPKQSMLVVGGAKDNKDNKPDKKIKGGMISLRVARVDLMQNRKKTIEIQTGTNKVSFKFNTKEEKLEWVQAFNKTIEWIVQTNPGHMSVNMGKQTMEMSSRPIGGGGFDSDSDDDDQVFFDEDQKKELKEALSLAFGSALVKENSQLTRYLADCWQAQAALEESLIPLREQYIESGNDKLR
jgi:hypothetical protein